MYVWLLKNKGKIKNPNNNFSVGSNPKFKFNPIYKCSHGGGLNSALKYTTVISVWDKSL